MFLFALFAGIITSARVLPSSKNKKPLINKDIVTKVDSKNKIVIKSDKNKINNN
jgi:hypothetical protein